jgi:hypothetical protein
LPSAFFVSGDGSDSNDGLTPGTAFATLATAYAATTNNADQIIYLLGTPTSCKINATLNWANSRTHLVGMAAPVGTSCRARLSVNAAFTPAVNVTGQGCIFQNFEIFNGYTSATSSSNNVCWTDGGGRNYYNGVHFASPGQATQAGGAGSRALTLSGNTGENLFVNCVIGVDTEAQSAASASLEVIAGAGSPRNRFIGCFFPNYTTANSPVFVKIGASSIDRYIYFEDCIFHNFVGTAQTEAFSFVVNAGGDIILHNCLVAPSMTLVTGNVANLYGDNAYAAATGQRGVALTG